MLRADRVHAAHQNSTKERILVEGFLSDLGPIIFNPCQQLTDDIDDKDTKSNFDAFVGKYAKYAKHAKYEIK